MIIIYKIKVQKKTNNQKTIVLDFGVRTFQIKFDNDEYFKKFGK